MKRQALRRMLSGFLAAVMVAALLPVTAMAVSEPGENSDQYKYAKSIQDELNEGIESDDMLYTLGGPYPLKDSDLYTYIVDQSYTDESTGTMISDTRYVIVPGIGGSDYNVPNYNNGNNGQPWAGTGSLSGIYIAKGVTGIGSYAFSGKTNVQKVEFQDASHLTYVGENAFSGLSSAAFTDEGNQDDPDTLNLSNVETLGSYAFSGCSQIEGVELGGSITAVEDGEETLNKIPEYAFQGTGLDTIDIPESVTVIGAHAFENCQLSELTLPSNLKEIEGYAFARPAGSPNTALTELTIPASVTTIGAHAFYNYQGLAMVTIEGNSLTTVEAGAFGDSEFTAHTREGEIDVGGQMITATLGTIFVAAGEADLDALLKNNENCYMGEVSPMVLVPGKGTPPTCETQGREAYRLTHGDDEAYYYRVLPALGHDYQFHELVAATCESGSYDLYVCANDESHTEHRNIQDDSTGHHYVLKSISNTAMADGTTTFVWECTNDNHGDEDQCEKELNIPITTNSLAADTTMTLGDLEALLPDVENGELHLADDVDESSPITTLTTAVHVEFVPDQISYSQYSGVQAVDAFNDQDLTLAVNAEKALLDFSGVSFGGTSVFVDTANPAGTAITVQRGSLPADVKYESPVYSIVEAANRHDYRVEDGTEYWR